MSTNDALGSPPRQLHSVADLIAAIRAFIHGYNERCQPFHWARTADQVLAKAQRNPSA
ncbi:hypothetical protein [Micromonospora costi]|uniref:hypothetical protein n=1 Tax=Micromonospora costi TaxID=1530042 RepID=UPI003F4D5B92